MILQYVLILSVSKCVNKNAWNIKSRTESETFLSLLLVGPFLRGRFMGSSLKVPPKYFGKIALKRNYATRHPNADAL